MIKWTAETRKLSELKAGFSEEALIALQQNSYPGNVRELEHIVERPLFAGQRTRDLTRAFAIRATVRSNKRGSKP